MKVLKDNENDLERSLRALGEIFPTLENDLTIRKKIESLQPLGYAPEPQVLAAFLLDFETLASKLSPGAWTDQDRLLSLISKINPRTFQEIRSHPTFRPRTDTFLEFKQVLQEKVKEDWVDRKLVTPKQLQVLSLDPQNQMQVDQAPQSSGSGPHNFQNRGRTKGQAPNIGKGKGKSTGRGNNSRNPSRNPPQNRFHATIVCKFCHKVGHYDDRCWVKYPHLKPTKRPPSRPPQQRNFQAKPKAQNQAPQIGFEPDEAQTNNKKRKINLLSTLVLSMGAKVNGKFVETIVDSGASASVVSANLVDPQRINRSQSVPVQVASGETIFTLGTTELELNLGGNTITQQALVLPTNAFQAVLGLDFLCTPPCQGLLTSPEPCRLLYDHREYPLKKITSKKDTYAFYKITKQFWKTESYTVNPAIKAKALETLNVDPREIEVDLFSNLKNHTRALFCRKENSAFWYNWAKLDTTLWANPPWTKLSHVLHKACLQPCKLILAHPVWEDESWYKLLKKIAIKTYHVEQGTPVFYTDKKVLLPSPSWQTAITLIDTTKKNVTSENLDPHIVGALLKIDRGFGREKLEKAVRLYPPISKKDRHVEATQIPQDDRGKIAQ
jgi:hypothetical protein